VNIETTINDTHQAEILVEIESERLEQEKRRAARKLARQVRIPGFRPGKAPYNIIARHLGEGQILNDALEQLVDVIYPEIIEEANIAPYGPGALEDIKLDAEPPTANFIIPLAPEVELGEYKDLRKAYEPPVIGAEEIDEFMEEMRSIRAELEPVDRAAEEGDMVRVQINATIEGDEDPLINNQTYPVVVDKEADDVSEEWPYPSFSRELLGLEKEAEKTTSYQFPDDHESEELKGKTAEFSIEVLEVSARTLPEIDDDFAKSLGSYETLDEYREDVQQHLESSRVRQYDSEYEDELLQSLIDNSSFKYPPEAVKDEIEVLQEQLEGRLGQQGLDLDTYKKSRSLDDEGLREELEPTAETRIQRSLILLEIAKAEAFELDQDRIQGEVTQTLQMMTQNLTKREAQRQINQNVVSGITTQAVNNALVEETLQYLRKLASGELEAAEAEEAEKPADEQAETEVATEVEAEVETEMEADDGPEAIAEYESPEAADVEDADSAEAEEAEAPADVEESSDAAEDA
jgi:trigger factor